jgi:hypothetical protein
MFEFQEFAKTIAYRAGYAIFAAVMIGTIFAYDRFPALHWWLMSAMFGVFAYSVAYAVVFSAVAKDALSEVDEVPQPPTKQKAQPTLPTNQPIREKAVRQNIEAEEVEVLPEHIRRVDKMIWADRLNINGRMVEMPAGFKAEWLYTLAKKRAAGQLETISLRALDDIGISRWGNGNSPALQVIAVLEKTECIESRGSNQPYVWTGRGSVAFPSPTRSQLLVN